MDAVTISSKYQVVIPKEVREKFNLKPGQKLVFIPLKGNIRVVVLPPVQELRGLFEGLDSTDLREEVDEERE